jgi:TfoX/Sxy family transcriptional regulator of competence genes
MRRLRATATSTRDRWRPPHGRKGDCSAILPEPGIDERTTRSTPMATEQAFVDYVVTQSGLEQRLSYRRMFGEYALYLGGKVVAFACSNQLLLKPTAEGRALIKNVTEGAPYPGAKMYLKIVDELEDRDQLRRLFETTAEVLPMPAPKRPRAKRKPATP